MGKRLYVGNLAFHTTDSNIQQHFAQAGTVESVHLLVDKMTGRSRGIAFVEMGTDAEATAAISQLNGKELDGRPLKVDEARPREPRPFQGGGGGGGFGGGGGGERRDRGDRRGRRDW